MTNNNGKVSKSNSGSGIKKFMDSNIFGKALIPKIFNENDGGKTTGVLNHSLNNIKNGPKSEFDNITKIMFSV